MQIITPNNHISFESKRNRMQIDMETYITSRFEGPKTESDVDLYYSDIDSCFKVSKDKANELFEY